MSDYDPHYHWQKIAQEIEARLFYRFWVDAFKTNYKNDIWCICGDKFILFIFSLCVNLLEPINVLLR